MAKIAALTVLGRTKLDSWFCWFSVSWSICVQSNSIICKPLLLLLLLLFLTNYYLQWTAIFSSIPTIYFPLLSMLLLFYVVIDSLVTNFSIDTFPCHLASEWMRSKNMTTTIRLLWRFLAIEAIAFNNNLSIAEYSNYSENVCVACGPEVITKVQT